MIKTVNNFKKGDIIVETFEDSTGTDVHFYEVVRTTPCSVELRKLNGESEGNYSGFCWPITGSYKNDKTYKCRLNKYGRPNIHTYSYSRLWDGKPVWWDSGYTCGDKAKYDEDREIYKKYNTKAE